jgi:3-oxoacyl-[acyl-carrier protein] reductase
MSLHGQVAIVTGASRGLGAAVARRLALEGAHLVLVARDMDSLSHVRDALVASQLAPGQTIVQQQADVARRDDVARVVEQAGQITGRIDILIGNAGMYGPIGPAEEVDWDAWVETIQVNLMGTVLCCRSVVPWMRHQGGGKIILLSGGGATAPLTRFSAYAASKAAVVRFGETLAEEVKDAGISVNMVAPGSLNTRLLDQVLAAGADAAGEDFHARALRQRETGGTPLDVPVDLIAFLASSASDGVTGRLLSAVWDDWRQLPNWRTELAGSDIYTLRRIVPEDRGWTKP